MYIDKYSDRVEFLYETINNYRQLFDYSNDSKEYIEFKIQEFIDVMVNDLNPIIEIYINSNIVEEKTIETLFNAVNDYVSILSNKLEYVNKRYMDTIKVYNNILLPTIKNMSLKLNTTSDDTSSNSIVEKFKDPNTVDGFTTTFSNGYLELSHETNIDPSTNHYVEIVSSNGLPGDTKRASLKDGVVTFNGESSLKTNIKNIFSSSDSLDYEMFNVNSSEYKKTSGKGFYYDEGVSFVSKDNKLYLELKIELIRPTSINGFTFNDCQVDSNYIIRDIKVTNNNGIKYSVAKNVVSSGVNVVNFKTDTIKAIYMYFEQYDYNECFIGHMYDNHIETNGTLYSETYNDISIGSITSLGCTITNDKVIHPNSKNVVYNDSYSKTKLYNSNYNRQLLIANRYNISLYNLQFINKQYKKGGYTVIKYNYTSPIKTVSFNADEYLPNTSSATFINYQISFDNENWHSIVPVYRTGANETNMISLNDVVTSTNLNVKTIFTNNTVNEFYIKVTLGTSDIAVSPIVKALYFNVESDGA